MISTDFSREGPITWQRDAQGNRGSQASAVTKLKFLGKDQVSHMWFPGCAVEELCRLTDNRVSTLTKWSRVIHRVGKPAVPQAGMAD